jgi:nitrate reductase gamma subunit
LAIGLILIGLAGYSHAAIGYALFLIATLLMALGAGLLAVFALTRAFHGDALRRAYAGAFWAGAWSYVLAVAALSGYFIHEAVAGRIEWRFVLFGPTALAAIIILDVGIWRIIVRRNLPTIGRFGDLWHRDSLDQDALRRTLVDEVLLHRTLFSVSAYRWARHQLILWGFGLMFLIELVAVAFREAFPAFGWTELWDQPLHPIRLSFDLAYDLTGLAVLVGCLMALGYRIRVNGTEQQKFTDTPTAVFLLVVVITGFVTEGARLAQMPDAPGNWASFVGVVFAPLVPASETGHQVLWVVHALAACAFIAYVPLKRLIHSCATPIGRLANSQTTLLSEKKRRSISGLMRRSG